MLVTSRTARRERLVIAKHFVMRPLLETEMAILASTLLFATIQAGPDSWKQEGSLTVQSQTSALIRSLEEQNNLTLSECTEVTKPEMMVLQEEPTFHPGEISGLIAWYASKEAYSDTGSAVLSNHYESVLRWKDQSPNNVFLSPGTAGNNPLLWKKGKKCFTTA